MNGITEKLPNSSENGDICPPSTSESAKMANSADAEPKSLLGPGFSKSAESEGKMGQNGPNFAQNIEAGCSDVKLKVEQSNNKPKINRRRKRRLSLLITNDDDDSYMAKQARSLSDNEEIWAERGKKVPPNDPIVSPVQFHHKSHKRKISESRKSRSTEKRQKIDKFSFSTGSINELVQTEPEKKFIEVTKTEIPPEKFTIDKNETSISLEKSTVDKNKTSISLEKSTTDKNKTAPSTEKLAENDKNQQKTGIFNPKSQKFIYGNYNQYYGKRIPKDSEIDDPRFRFLKLEWFLGKTVLDVGCNIGLVTSHVAKHFKPRLITGIDIDPHLVGIARKNIRRYAINEDEEELGALGKPKIPKVMTGDNEASTSTAQSQQEQPIFAFPNNILFKQADYEPANDRVLDLVRPEYDVIIAFSITKWIHLNWGDDGLKRFFKRIFKNLNPGGILLLEPQAMPSYRQRKKLTPEIFSTFKSIKFLPEQFNSYLLSEEVGFESVKTVGVPIHKSKGFSRPIFMFKKADKDSELPKNAAKDEESK